MTLEILPIAIDDGNAQFKTVTPTEKFKFNSHIKRGTANIGSVSDTDDSSQIKVYTTTDGSTYSVGDVDVPIPRTDDFAYSEASKVLLQHAIAKVNADLSKTPFVLCTGMPLREFFKYDGDLNTANIKRKILATRGSFDILLSGGIADSSEKIKSNELIKGILVQPEAVSAVYNYYYHEVDGKIVVNEKYRGKVFAVVDPGGKTTDIGVITDLKVDMDRSSTRDVGFNNLIKQAKNFIYDQGITEPTDHQARQLIETGILRVRGQDIDCSEWQKSVRLKMAKDILDEITESIGNGNRIDYLLLIGGTVKALMKELVPLLDEKYGSDFYMIPSEPDFANAFGLAMFIRLWIQKTFS